MGLVTASFFKENIMQCRNCGASMPIGNEYCLACGVKSEREYLSTYWKKEFDKIEATNERYKGKWNWVAFFTSLIWFFTKGMWKKSLLLFALLFLTIDFGLFPLFTYIYGGARANYSYYKYMVEKQDFTENIGIKILLVLTVLILVVINIFYYSQGIEDILI